MMQKYIEICATNTMIRLVIFAVIVDTIFGIGRAIKERELNSSIGIDGAIRKIGMVISILFCVMTDMLVHVNLLRFLPKEIQDYMGGPIGTVEFFGLLYLGYESVSTLKNMALCGLPVRRVWDAVRKFLSKYTDELPDEDGLAKKAAAKNKYSLSGRRSREMAERKALKAATASKDTEDDGK